MGLRITGIVKAEATVNEGSMNILTEGWTSCIPECHWEAAVLLAVDSISCKDFLLFG